MSPSQARHRSWLTLVTAVSLLLPFQASIAPAQADDAVAPKNQKLTIEGAGWGHGRGMSQYGAYGAASKGLTFQEILDFYYPGTKLESLSAGNKIKVLITADKDKVLHFRPEKGLRVSDSSGKKVTLPTGAKYTKWRITRSGKNRVLWYLNQAGKYVKYSNKLIPTRQWYVSNPASQTVRVALPAGTVRYRGQMMLLFDGDGAITVNKVSMEDYLRSVVPAEMPASWHVEAVKAQAVAARSYAAQYRDRPKNNAGYDICDTTACQVYKGTGHEAKQSDAAVKATADQILTHGGKPAWTEFSSSNGGWTVAGDFAYLKARKDPYDSVKKDQTWTKTITSAEVEKAYPQIGTLKSIQVVDRDGNGAFGGRVATLKVKGSKTTLTVTGAAFKSKFGLKERLFTITGATGNNGPTDPKEPNEPPPSEQADQYGLTGAVSAAYAGVGGPKSKLGLPRTKVLTNTAGSYADFDLGRITCPAKGECLVSYG